MARVVIDQRALDWLCYSPESPIGRDLERRGIRVESAAVRLCPVGETGRLGNNITHEMGRDAQGQFVRVGTNVTYALHVELGTGLWGPKRAVIRPKTKKALYWPGARHPVAYVKGSRPQPFLRPSLAAGA